MTILIGNYEFQGPYKTVASLKEEKGLFAVLLFENEEYELIRLSQAENLREHIEISQSAFRSAYSPITGTILLAAYYTPKSCTRERVLMLADIEAEFEDHDDQHIQEYDKKLLTEAAS